MATYTNQSKNSASYSYESRSLTDSFLLLENGDKLLLEAGGKIILEQSSGVSQSYTLKTKS